MSLEDLSYEARDELALLARQLAENPKTRKAFLRLTKEAKPDMPIPELEIEDSTNYAVQKANDRVAHLEARLQQKDAMEELNKRRSRLKEKGLVENDEQVEEVDIVGHAWFFRREWLSTFWRELPSIEQSTLVGEDMHFSYTLQKYLGKKTFVPPHPKNQVDKWGSIPMTAWSIGQDSAAISMNFDNLKIMSDTFVNYINKGFQLMKNR